MFVAFLVDEVNYEEYQLPECIVLNRFTNLSNFGGTCYIQLYHGTGSSSRKSVKVVESHVTPAFIFLTYRLYIKEVSTLL
jgi:hypothetical protein